MTSVHLSSDSDVSRFTLDDDTLPEQDQNTSIEEQEARSMANTLGIDFVCLSEVELSANISRIIPQWLVTEQNVIAVKFQNDALYVAMTNPQDLPLLDQINLVTGLNIKPMVATKRDIILAINQYYGAKQITRQGYADAQFDGMASQNDRAIEKLTLSDKDGQIVRLVNSIIKDAIDTEVSDIHLQPDGAGLLVRMRTDGILRDYLTVPSSMWKATVSRIKVLAGMDITEKRRSQDGNIQIAYNDSAYDLRVSIIPTVLGEKTVLRVLDKNRLATSLETLGLTPEDYTTCDSATKRPFGMILVTGPTGSGKTTTLYAMLKNIDTAKKNIITIENPVEYRLDRINQIQIASDIGETFASSLRAILRQDPDVIMVGEIRDEETAEIAVQAALTGHLVLSTLHTNDAVGAISRLRELGIPSYLLSSCIVMAIAQRLVRKICPYCKESYQPDAKSLEQIGLSTSQATFYRGAGCRNCLDTGYRGREATFEIIKVTEEVQMAIAEDRNTLEIRNHARKFGMKTLLERAAVKAEMGITTVDEVKRVVASELL